MQYSESDLPSLHSYLSIYVCTQFAFYLAKAAVILQAKTNATSTFTFFDTAFSRQEEILNGPTAEKTPTDVKDRVRYDGLH